jgi:hypothetical protein
MNHKFPIRAVLAAVTLAALFALSTAVCFAQSGGKAVNSAEDLKKYLDSQPANSPDKPIKVAMKVNDNMIKNIVKAINDAGKYVSLDLTGSPLTNIPQAAFYEGKDEYNGKGCATLVGIIIPKGITIIENGVFYRCKNLKSVTIPNSVTEIWVAVFNGCESLTSITIPNSVTSIGEIAFSGCPSLTSVTFEGTIDSNGLDRYAFDGDLRDKYLAGGKGTYTTTAPVGEKSVWKKQ